MNLIGALIVGGLAGWGAGKIIKGKDFGVLMNILLGIVGGFVGNWVFGLLGISSDDGFIGSLITALVGAVLLLFIVKKLKK